MLGRYVVHESGVKPSVHLLKKHRIILSAIAHPNDRVKMNFKIQEQEMPFKLLQTVPVDRDDCQSITLAIDTSPWE